MHRHKLTTNFVHQQPAEKAAEDSLMFPWKQREILMFEIPVHDSERAGLGEIFFAFISTDTEK